MMNKKLFSLAIIFVVLTMFISLSFGNSSNEGELKVTLEHPFLINDEWISASELEVGDELTTIDGKKARITSIEKVEVEEGVEVYNLEDDFGINNYVVGDERVVVHNSQKLLPTPLKPNEIKLLPAPHNCKYDDGTKIASRYISTQDVTLKNVRPQVQQEIIRKIETGEWIELAVTNVNPCNTLNQRILFLERAIPKPGFLYGEPGLSMTRYFGPKEYLPEISKLGTWTQKRALLGKLLRGKGKLFQEIGAGKVVKTHEYGYYAACPDESYLNSVIDNPDLLKGLGGNLPTGHRHFHLEHYFYEEVVKDSNGNIIGFLLK